MADSILVVSTWGFPGRWALERYIIPSPPREIADWDKSSRWNYSEDRQVQSHSSSVALAAGLRKGGWNVKLSVYVLDTLAAPPKINPEKLGNDNIAKEAAKELNELIKKWCEDPPENYSEIVERAREVATLYLRKFINFINDEMNLNLDIKEVKVHILPGVGMFRLGFERGRGCASYIFRSSPQNTLTTMEYHLLDDLLELRPNAVILDTSHGINYMPVLALQAVRWTLKVYSALQGRGIGAAIVNSDPPPGDASGQQLRLHVVDTRAMKKSLLGTLASVVEPLAKGTSDRGRYTPVRFLSADAAVEEFKDARRKFEKTAKSILDRYLGLAKALAAASKYGLILYIATKLNELNSRDIEKDSERIKEALDKLLGLVKVRVEEGKTIIVDRPYSVDVSLVLNPLYMLKLLKRMLGEIEQLSGKAWDTGNALLFPLNVLNDLADKVGVEGAGSMLLRNEFNDIERRVKNYVGSHSGKLGPVPYSTVYEAVGDLKNETTRGERTIRGDKCSIISKRNFYAHAGMERNTVMIALDENGKIFVGYNREYMKCIEKIIS